MVWSVTLTVLMHIFLIFHGVQCLEPKDKASPLSPAFKLPWQDELCCDTPLAQCGVERGPTRAAKTNRSETNLPHSPQCNFRNSTREMRPNFSSGTCWDVRCRIDESWANLTCELQPHKQPSITLSAGLTVVSLQRLFENSNKEMSDQAYIHPVVCKGKDFIVCSLPIDPATSFVAMVTVNISNSGTSSVLLRIPALPVKPSPPVSLSHFQTNKAELIVLWKDASDFISDPLRYEVQYYFNTNHPNRQVVSVYQPRISLHLKPYLKYTIQVRCSRLEDPPLWSNWSKPHFIYLGEVSYIPEQVVARPGENVSVYCVFNNRRMNASTAVWKLNGKKLDESLSHPVNEWVSQIIFPASETGIYDVLQCKKNFSIPYSQIYVQGGFIDINCTTSGDIDAMECKWTNKERHKLTLFFEWASTCDVMKEMENSGEVVLKNSSSCKAVKSSDKFCTISPLKVGYCYKLWMGLCMKDITSAQCSIQSKPIYISPLDHVKPHRPTNVVAKTSSGVLKVTWDRPKLPVQSLQFQSRFRSTDTGDWKVQDPLQSQLLNVVVPDMCKVYIVQVRCMLKSGKGYWSDWSDPAKSIPENSRVPERGPGFWRIRQDTLDRNHSNITVLFQPSESFPVSGKSYCVDGFIVQHRYANGSVRKEKMSQLSPYSFDWNQEHQTVTVEAFNTLGSSINNMNMTLEKQPKRRCVKSFHALLINSTCVSLSWSLLDSSPVPQFMVVQWFPQRQQDYKDYDWSQYSWVRLPYTDFPIYIQRVFLFEEYNFHLYPVFPDGEGEPVITSASRGQPAAYGMLMSIAFLCIFLLVTLCISQKQVKRLVWKDVPNPKKCSWAKGLDLKKVDPSDKLFQSPEFLQALPSLLASEDISKVIVTEEAPKKSLIQKPLVSSTQHCASVSSTSLPVVFDQRVNHLIRSETFHDGFPSISVAVVAFTTSNLNAGEFPPTDPPIDQHPGCSDTSAQSPIIYAKVQHVVQQPIHTNHKDDSGSSSSDEGIFSPISSDMLPSVSSDVWKPDSCHGAEINRLGRSTPSRMKEDLCKTSKQGGEREQRQEEVLHYLCMEHLAESETNEEEQRDGKTKYKLLGNVALHKQDCSVVSCPLLDLELQSVSTCGFPSLYMPQCRTAPYSGQLSA